MPRQTRHCPALILEAMPPETDRMLPSSVLVVLGSVLLCLLQDSETCHLTPVRLTIQPPVSVVWFQGTIKQTVPSNNNQRQFYREHRATSGIEAQFRG